MVGWKKQMMTPHISNIYFSSSLMFNYYCTVPLVVVQGTFISLKQNFQ